MSLTDNIDATIGDDFEPTGDSIATAGICLGSHGNAIEIHREKLEDAKELRDLILKLIKDYYEGE